MGKREGEREREREKERKRRREKDREREMIGCCRHTYSDRRGQGG